ncbi:hypothetical protein W97_09093 [Coniosporium apollinis CBS 100218]|uniref:Uncharacterized protein n=1 Tax=Coniosporium apollinis (strain CBS 100218) TaxID=1168221 RepID=R7Z6L1_CONA1|nr:uncharacterized protein W97_09093 [Coniosporium apollinis CBS 100218]EON69830.1 hypothetical protein W97_09093 [Coniosporium apollinis CBS 100218]
MSTFGTVRILPRPLDALFPRHVVDPRAAEDNASVVTSDSEDGGVAIPLSLKKKKKKHRAGKKHRRSGNKVQGTTTSADTSEINETVLIPRSQEVTAKPLASYEDTAQNYEFNHRLSHDVGDYIAIYEDRKTSPATVFAARSHEPSDIHRTTESPGSSASIPRREGAPGISQRASPVLPPGNMSVHPAPDKTPVEEVDLTTATGEYKTPSPATVLAKDPLDASKVAPSAKPATLSASARNHSEATSRLRAQATPFSLPEDLSMWLSPGGTLVEGSDHISSRKDTGADDGAELVPQLAQHEIYKQAREEQNEARRKTDAERRSRQIVRMLEAEQEKRLAAVESKLVPYTNDVAALGPSNVPTIKSAPSASHNGGGTEAQPVSVRRNDHFYRKLVSIQDKQSIPMHNSNPRSRMAMSSISFASMPPQHAAVAISSHHLSRRERTQRWRMGVLKASLGQL